VEQVTGQKKKKKKKIKRKKREKIRKSAPIGYDHMKVKPLTLSNFETAHLIVNQQDNFLNPTQYVCINGNNSTVKPIQYGVAQGLTMGPLLFLIYQRSFQRYEFNP